MNIQVIDEGSILLLDPHDDAAAEWLAENLNPDAMRWGQAFVVEPRCAGAILNGFTAAGGEVTL